MTTLADLLTLSRAAAPDTFTGKSVAYGNIGVYGGHLLGQALSAAFMTIEDDKIANSLHGYFLKAGNPASPIDYAVTRVRDGRGFANRLVMASQDGVPVFQMIASFKLPEPGDAHQKPMPVAPDPDKLVADRIAAGGERFRFPMTVDGRVEMELVSAHFVPAEFAPGRSPELQCWTRVPESSHTDASMRQCILAFLSDGTLMFNSVLPYGIPFRNYRLTSLDQSVWFHNECDPQQWLLFDQRSTAAADGRGLNEGEIFDQSGRLVISVAQESMLRKMPAA